MDITNVSVRRYDSPKNNLKGFAQVTLDDEFVLTGIKIVKGSKGLFVAMPSTYWESDDTYHDIFFPITKEFREELQEEILEAYKDADEKPKKSKKKSKKSKRDEDEEDD